MAQLSPIIQDGILTYLQDGSPVQIVVDSSDWYAWLQTASTFTFRGEHSSFTAHKERAGNRRGRLYWRAYCTWQGKLHRAYLGKSEELTLAQLESVAVAVVLASKGEGDNSLDVPSLRAGTRPSAEASSRARSHLRRATGAPSPHEGVISKPWLASLPVPLTSLIGREQEVQAICDLLSHPEVRLLTITGTGGVGKTRLALEVAGILRADFPDGICFVPLAPVSDPARVLAAIAQALGLWEAAELSPEQQVRVALRDRHLLLLLDNFEQVVAASPLLVQTCPQMKVLVTSRAVLRVSGEQEFPVPPLPLPDLRRLPPLPESEPLTQNAAVVLFLERARALKPDFQLTPTNVRSIAEICVRLDGLPLAIELAAARIKLLPPQALLSRLSQRFQVLTSGSRTMPERQQTLRNTIQWSYDLLSPQEQQLFRRLSVFVDGCTLEATEAVCGAPGPETADILDGVASLIDKSLLQQTEQEGEESRLLMLETIREYEREALAASGEAETIRRAHATYYLSLVEKAEPHLTGAEQVWWLDRLEREHDNLLTALSWLVEGKETALALRLATALRLYWLMRGHVSEGQGWLEKALVDSSKEATPVRARALYAAARLAYYLNDYDYAAVCNEASLKLYREQGDQQGIASALNGLGHLALAQGDYAAIRTLCQESLALLRAVGDRWRIAEALFLLSYEAYARSDHTNARALCEESLALSRQVGDRNVMAQVLHALGYFAYQQGDYGRAYLLQAESLAMARAVGQKWLTAACLEGLGEVAGAQGQPARATRLWGAAAALRQAVGMRIVPVERAAYERALATVRAQLGEQAFAAAWAEGRTMSLEQALAGKGTAEIPATISMKPPSAPQAQTPPISPAGLTTREMEVLRLLAQGLTSAQIAQRLVIGLVTVNSHVRSIYNKLGVTSRAAATRYALEHHLL